MHTRGQRYFPRLPFLAAKLYDRGSRFRPIRAMYATVARDLVSMMKRGRLLDVGTGPGRLLAEVAKLNLEIELFGIDISKAMIRLAARNLSTVRAEVSVGDIRETEFPDEYFDLVTCTGSLYLWDEPIECLNEVHRLLKEGASAYLYESHREYDAAELRKGLKANLAGANPLLRLMGPRILKWQLAMTYTPDEVRCIVESSRFGSSYMMQEVTLARLPVWLRIELLKGRSGNAAVSE
jgi:ubiquinone/menaquinone biosynthesis C-methylase UbiE